MCIQVLGEKKAFMRAFIERGGSVGNRGRPAMCIQVLGEEERKERRRRKKGISTDLEYIV